MIQPSTPHAYEGQAAAQRNTLADTLRATEQDLADTRRREAAVRRQLTRTEQVLADEEQNSARELTAAIEGERSARRYRAAWRSARRRASNHAAALDAVLDRSALAYALVDTVTDLQTAEAARDGAYRERAHLTAWLATLHPAVLAPATDVDEPGWQILYLTAGGRQLSWHIHPRDAELYAHVEQVPADDPRAQWDGHTTEEKYEAIRGLTFAQLGKLECGCWPLNGCDCGMHRVTEVVRGGRRLNPRRAPAAEAEQVVTLPSQPVPPGPLLAQPCATQETALDRAVRQIIATARDLAPDLSELYVTRTAHGRTGLIVAHPHTLGRISDASVRLDMTRGWPDGHNPFAWIPRLADDTFPPGAFELRADPAPEDAL